MVCDEAVTTTCRFVGCMLRDCLPLCSPYRPPPPPPTLQAYDVVCDEAVTAACRIVGRMLRDCPRDIVSKLASEKARVRRRHGCFGRGSCESWSVRGVG